MPMNPRLLRPILSGDPDARRYIAAVQQADQQSLEPAVRKAINDFVVGCKADGIWDAIKASCILAGARTLTGALVPLKGAAPTNNNFVSGDYDRETGLVGDGASKFLDTNRNTNLDPQDNVHMAVYATTANSGTRWYMGAGSGGAGSTHLLNVSANFSTRARNATADTTGSNVAGLFGLSRNNSDNFIMRAGSTDFARTRASETAFDGNVLVYLVSSSAAAYSNSRLTFFSTGLAVDLALLDTRVSALVTAIGAAI